MMLITTPTGDIGTRVLAHVLDAGKEARVIARNPARLPEAVRSRVDIFEGSHADPAVIVPALSGVDAVFWLPPGNLDAQDAETAYCEFSRAFCDALRGSPVRRVVGISALGRGWPKPAGQVSATIQVDDMIAGTGVHYRALTCASLMDNLLRQVDLIRTEGVFYQPVPQDLKLPHVAKSDVARTAARLLEHTEWTGVDEVPLHGPENLTYDQMAEILSEALKRPIRFREISMEAFGDLLRSTGCTEGMARAAMEMMIAKSEGMDTMTRPESRSATPTSFQTWCENELRPVIEYQENS
ncbi:NAD(P)H-binding protein [Salipiger abyssi]|uniref:NAD(P)H-binding protein n=1 Tax=Salipiger abyssi TaxID=1250539 RepID=UPI000976D589|nr:NAD(P)H-binding protein [Salipiger abyssi]